MTILLSDSELSEMGVSFQQLSVARPQTRRALQTVIRAARERAGLSARRVRVEAIPTGEGCMLLITPLPARRVLRIRRLEKPLVYAVASTDDLLALAKSLRRRGTLPPALTASSLYRAQEGYRLILYAARPAAWLPRMLGEYARLIGQGQLAAALTEEHAIPLVLGHALDALAYSACS